MGKCNKKIHLTNIHWLTGGPKDQGRAWDLVVVGRAALILCLRASIMVDYKQVEY